MEPLNPSLTMLFEQLGLAYDEASINAFIAQNPLRDEIKLIDAPLWTPAQVQLLKEKLLSDDNWAPVVDELNERLHLPPTR